MADKVTFDATNRLIIFNDGVSACDAKEDIYSDWKEWFKVDGNAKYLHAFRTTGGDELAPGSYLGAYFFLTNGWRMRPYEGTHQLNVDGNLFVDGGGNPFVPTVGNYNVLVTLNVSSISTSLVTEIPEIQYSSYNGGITVDVNSTYSGADYPVGTFQQPVNNIPDAVTIANNKGFDKLFIIGNLTLGTGHNVDDFSFIGESPVKTEITIETDASTVGCEFQECTINGLLDGNSILEHCEVNSLDYVNGEIRDCRLGGPITLGGGVKSLFLNCGGVNPGIPPIIDMGASGQDCIFHDYSGGLKFQNMTSGSNQIRVQIDGGKVVLMPSVSAGSVTVVGIGLLVDQNGDVILSGIWNGVTITNALVNTDTVADATWEAASIEYSSDGTFGDVINKIKKLVNLIPAGL